MYSAYRTHQSAITGGHAGHGASYLLLLIILLRLRLRLILPLLLGPPPPQSDLIEHRFRPACSCSLQQTLIRLLYILVGITVTSQPSLAAWGPTITHIISYYISIIGGQPTARLTDRPPTIPPLRHADLILTSGHVQTSRDRAPASLHIGTPIVCMYIRPPRTGTGPGGRKPPRRPSSR